MATPVAIQHNIFPARVLFVYRADDADSLEVAQYYARKRQLEATQLLGVQTRYQNEIDYDYYLNHIETPILQYITERQTLDHVSGHFNVVPWCIILGYNIPHIINYHGEMIAVASRLHRLGHPVDLKRPNHTFDRKTWRFFDDRDNTELYITAVIDGPTKQNAINLIDRSIAVDNLADVKGTINLDPYGNKLTTEQLSYQDEILTFIEKDIARLGSLYETTTDIDDPYKDPSFLRLHDESFYWGWYEDTTSPGVFRDSRTKRAFLYNADDEGLSDIKEDTTEGGHWPAVALAVNNPGYAAVAGAVDAPDENSYLYPRPFFEALHREAAIGEAFLYANKYVDWKLVLVGDPLMVVRFPLVFNEALFYTSNKEILYLTIRAIEAYLKKVDRLSRILDDIVQYGVDSNDFDTMQLFYSTVKWRDNIAAIARGKQYVGGLVKSLANYYARTHGEESFSDWLANTGQFKVTSRFQDIYQSSSSQTISDDLLFESGEWEINFNYTHSRLTLENIYFVIQVARDSNFTNVVYFISSADSVNGWWYEKEVSDFSSLPEDGFPSNYAGRRIRFVSPERYYLRETEKYFYRVFIDDSGGEQVVDTTELIA